MYVPNISKSLTLFTYTSTYIYLSDNPRQNNIEVEGAMDRVI